MQMLSSFSRHTSRHVPTILVALFVLLVVTATSASRRGPVLDMRGGAPHAGAGWSAF